MIFITNNQIRKIRNPFMRYFSKEYQWNYPAPCRDRDKHGRHLVLCFTADSSLYCYVSTSASYPPVVQALMFPVRFSLILPCNLAEARMRHFKMKLNPRSVFISPEVPRFFLHSCIMYPRLLSTPRFLQSGSFFFWSCAAGLSKIWV